MLGIVGKDNFSFEPMYLNMIRFTFIELKNFIDNQRFQYYWKDDEAMKNSWEGIKQYVDDISAIRNAMGGHLDDTAIQHLINERPEGFIDTITLESQRILLGFGLLESCINNKCKMHNYQYSDKSFSFMSKSDQQAFINFTFKLVDTILELTEFIVLALKPLVNKENGNELIAQLINKHKI